MADGTLEGTFPTPQFFFRLYIRTCDLTKKGALPACPFDVRKLFSLIRRFSFLHFFNFAACMLCFLQKVTHLNFFCSVFACLDTCESALPGEMKKTTRSRAVSVTEAIPRLVPNLASDEFSGTATAQGILWRNTCPSQ